VKKLPNQERGMVLLVSLILLLILTILAITAASTSTLQQRMANNAQEQNTSFQAAESGLARWMILFNAGAAIPAGVQPAGSNASFELTVNVQANCISGSLGIGGGFVFDCYHITSNARTDTDARSRHQMGYLTRIGQ
jgi:type IV pilus assembly protein PilX